jgi:hypothetical protein
LGGRREGFGTTLDLPAYENDVLNALTRSGGLPGLEAVNEIIVYRGYLGGDLAEVVTPGLLKEEDGSLLPPVVQRRTSSDWESGMVRIPLRMYPGEEPGFRPEDIILQQGDIVFVEARQADVFYTGGLLPSGEYPLPRDYDLDVVEAVVQIGGPLLNGGLNSDNFSGAIVGEGLGNPSPKLLTVVRRMPDGGLMPIQIDLNKATREPSLRILVQPGDLLVLQETPGQAVIRYMADVFRFDFIREAIKNSRTVGAVRVVTP